MSTLWVLVADGAKARMFSLAEGVGPLAEIEDFINPDGRAAGRDLSRNRPPSVHDRFGEHRHSIEPHTRQRDKAAEQFARELNAVLEQGCLQHRYQNLVVMAPPRFLGALKAAWDKQVQACVVAELPKDLTEADSQTIYEHIPAQFRPHHRQGEPNR